MIIMMVIVTIVIIIIIIIIIILISLPGRGWECVHLDNLHLHRGVPARGSQVVLPVARGHCWRFSRTEDPTVRLVLHSSRPGKLLVQGTLLYGE